MNGIAIRPAQPGEMNTLAALLETEELPVAGLEQTDLFVLEEDGDLIGTVGIEVHSPYALLRSLTVSSEIRGRGHGLTLLAFAHEEARRRGLRAVFGLTTTIPDLLATHGFRYVAREDLPTELDTSAELRGACPASAQAFRKDLL
jgi:amino-acid N-acetyltransferase